MSTSTAKLSSLLRASPINDHPAVLAAADAAIAVDATDAVAHRARVVALLQLERFSDAAHALEHIVPVAVRRRCRLEHVYALYKCARLDDAAAALAGPDADVDTAPALAHLNAQVAYRAGRFADAHRGYCRLVAGAAPDDSATASDLAINLTAAAAQMTWHGDHEPPRLVAGAGATATAEPDAFELCYNLACEAIARDDLTRADALLARALVLLDKALDMTANERTAERLPLQVQVALVAAQLGRKADASQTLNSITPLSRDQDVLAGDEIDHLIRNNLTALEAAEASTNPFLLHRRQPRPSSDAADALSAFQLGLLCRNRIVLDFQAQKLASVEAKAKASRTAAGTAAGSAAASEHGDLSVLGAAARAVTSTRPLAAQLLAGLDRRPHDLGLLLLLVQTLCQAGKLPRALRHLEAFLRHLDATPTLDLRASPGLVALAVELYGAVGRSGSARAELAALTANTAAPLTLREHAAICLLLDTPAHVPAAATAAFEALCAPAADHPPSLLAQLGLIASAGAGADAARHLDRLLPVDALVAGVAVGDLLEAGVVFTPGSKKRRATGAASETTIAPPKKRRCRSAASVVAAAVRCKSYQEGRVPDPERWLPLRDRSSYKPKSRKARKKAADSMQGGTVRSDDIPSALSGAAPVAAAATAPLPASTTTNKKRKVKK